MTFQDQPKIYLITPPVVDLTNFPNELAGLLDQFDIACLRISIASTDEVIIKKTADILRIICHEREVPILMENHYRLVKPLGLDGVHLSNFEHNLRDIRKELGQDSLIGVNCGTSKHTGITAGEIGADYICFGPLNQTALGDKDIASFEIFEWWSQMIEIPVVAEGNLNLDSVEKLSPVVDWFAFRDEIWNSSSPPHKILNEFIDRIG